MLIPINLNSATFSNDSIYIVILLEILVLDQFPLFHFIYVYFCEIFFFISDTTYSFLIKLTSSA
jgi:hypothetical protein